MSEEKIKKMMNGQFFFLVGPDSSSSEESSTVEYSVCALRRDNLIRKWVNFQSHRRVKIHVHVCHRIDI